MDPVSLIVSALGASAMSALQETAGTAIKDAYAGLAKLVEKKFAKDPKAATALEGYKEDPETWQKPLEKAVRDTKLGEDQEVLVMAQKLLEMMESQKSGGKFNNVKISDSQGFVVGDGANIGSMNFAEAPKSKKKKK